MNIPRNARVGAGLFLAAVAAFAVTDRLRGPDSRGIAQAPPLIGDDQVTPVPGATPDITQPGWYDPYVNAEREKPRFKGTIAGVQIDADWKDPRNGFDVCPGTGLVEPYPTDLLGVVLGPALWASTSSDFHPALLQSIRPQPSPAKANW